MSLNEVVLLLGSNKNFPEKNIDQAIDLIIKRVGVVIKKSSKKNTIPLEFVSKNNFCNIVIVIKTQFSPIQLLLALKSIEREMGRTFDSASLGAYEDRIIDLDIVCYNKINYKSSILNIPHHKHLYEREFAKLLLKEININEYEK